MNIRKFAFIAALGLCTAGSAWAKDYKVGQIEIDDVWVRASAPGQSNGAGYMDIDKDAKTEDRLLSVSSEAAERVELHTVLTENGVSKMRQVEGGIVVPADAEVKLSPGGYHVMFIKLRAPFKDGATVPATLKFEKAGEVAVQFKVKPASHNPGMSMNHDHGAMKH